jgi:hypothetical protein
LAALGSAAADEPSDNKNDRQSDYEANAEHESACGAERELTDRAALAPITLGLA